MTEHPDHAPDLATEQHSQPVLPCQGVWTPHALGHALGLSSATVQRQVPERLEQLGVRNRRAAIVTACSQGFMTPHQVCDRAETLPVPRPADVHKRALGPLVERALAPHGRRAPAQTAPDARATLRRRLNGAAPVTTVTTAGTLVGARLRQLRQNDTTGSTPFPAEFIAAAESGYTEALRQVLAAGYTVAVGMPEAEMVESLLLLRQTGPEVIDQDAARLHRHDALTAAAPTLRALSRTAVPWILHSPLVRQAVLRQHPGAGHPPLRDVQQTDQRLHVVLDVRALETLPAATAAEQAHRLLALADAGAEIRLLPHPSSLDQRAEAISQLLLPTGTVACGPPGSACAYTRHETDSPAAARQAALLDDALSAALAPKESRALLHRLAHGAPRHGQEAIR